MAFYSVRIYYNIYIFIRILITISIYIFCGIACIVPTPVYRDKKALTRLGHLSVKDLSFKKDREFFDICIGIKHFIQTFKNETKLTISKKVWFV